jgi:hypothetical protein
MGEAFLAFRQKSEAKKEGKPPRGPGECQVVSGRRLTRVEPHSAREAISSGLPICAG